MKLARKIKFGSKIFTHKLTGIGIILTRDCNLNCTYCQVIKQNNHRNLKLGQWKQIIDNLIKNKYLQFVFTGGEPLLYPHIFELIDYTYPKALTSLITNGTLLTKENIGKLKNLDFLNISLDALPNDTSFKKTAFKQLPLIYDFAKKFKRKVFIITCITKKNIEQIPEIIRIISHYKFDFRISMLHSGGENHSYRGYHPELDFRTEEDMEKIKTFQHQILEMKAQGYRIAESTSFINDIMYHVKKSFQMDCWASEDYFCINNDGYLMACHDSLPSQINALDNYTLTDMKANLKKTLPSDCTCFYDCYYNRALFRKNPLKFFKTLLSQKIYGHLFSNKL